MTDTARIKQALREMHEHRGDLFVLEAYDGPLWTRDKTTLRSSAGRRLDAWAMPRSWTETTITGYEIKASTKDFRRDHKWRDYLGLCNAFYFATPVGVIDRDELPPEAGLIELAGGRLLRKKAAPTRDADIPASMFRGLLMRARIDGDGTPEDSREARMRKFAEARSTGKEVAALACAALRFERQALAEARQEIVRLTFAAAEHGRPVVGDAQAAATLERLAREIAGLAAKFRSTVDTGTGGDQSAPQEVPWKRSSD
jgi:hypothetical protein